ncbi:Pseudopilin GspJ [Novipirellula galeiformis]|uniref:Pseudopilin GspJ n=1 Tax=Novipirellula galeiformis TaxID=2528004 RepID=A0A5C6C2R0_9BACT|nr:prepilin-type N-terminal cleavage/methylation domain-containing protein [Novipirellula galeiformis]TWU17139.1 Pseudopilin GspJ [Novipirellula galeiformis]
MIRVPALKPREAFSLLELMLALALLGALMSVAWSLMGTYRDAEERGWKVARRTQVIRSARNWLENDIQHLAATALPERSLHPSPSASIASTTARLTGNTQGFSATIVPSLDPLPFLERLMSDPAADEFEEPILSSTSAVPATPTTATPWPAERLEIEYRLSPSASPSSSQVNSPNVAVGLDTPDVQYTLIRSELSSPNSISGSDTTLGSSEATSAADRLLTAQDLYRQNEDQPIARGVPLKESRLEGLLECQFRYCDGQSWKSSWNSDIDGGLPTAIALSFNFPARSEMRRPEPPRPSSGPFEDELDNTQDDLQLSFADSALATEPVAEVSTAGEESLMQREGHEVTIVVLVEARPMSRPASAPFSGPFTGSYDAPGGDF